MKALIYTFLRLSKRRTPVATIPTRHILRRNRVHRVMAPLRLTAMPIRIARAVAVIPLVFAPQPEIIHAEFSFSAFLADRLAHIPRRRHRQRYSMLAGAAPAATGVGAFVHQRTGAGSQAGQYQSPTNTFVTPCPRLAFGASHTSHRVTRTAVVFHEPSWFRSSRPSASLQISRRQRDFDSATAEQRRHFLTLAFLRRQSQQAIVVPSWHIPIGATRCGLRPAPDGAAVDSKRFANGLCAPEYCDYLVCLAHVGNVALTAIACQHEIAKLFVDIAFSATQNIHAHLIP